MPRHTHRAKGEGEDRGWIYCVTPAECAANPARQQAHGNIIRTDMCSCGATRSSEVNGGRVNFGPWKGGKDDE